MEHNLVLCPSDIVIHSIFFVIRVSLLNNATRFPFAKFRLFAEHELKKKFFYQCFAVVFFSLARCMYALFKCQRFTLVVFSRLLISTQ